MGIQEYLHDLLDNQLSEIKYRYRIQIVDDIKNRMCALLAKWEQRQFEIACLKWLQALIAAGLRCRSLCRMKK